MNEQKQTCCAMCHELFTPVDDQEFCSTDCFIVDNIIDCTIYYLNSMLDARRHHQDFVVNDNVIEYAKKHFEAHVDVLNKYEEKIVTQVRDTFIEMLTTKIS